MPLYTLRNTETGEIEEVIISIASMTQKTESGKYVQIPGAPSIVMGVGSPLKNTPDGFKDVLREVKRRSPASDMEIN
jgi:hypothetical protein